MRLPFRHQVGQLADVAPGWLVETVRPAPGRPHWGAMARTAVAVTGPLVAAMLAGSVTLGLLPAMGAMAASLADRGGSYRGRVIRMGAAGAGGAVGFVVGDATRGLGWWTVAVVVVMAVLSALISTTGGAGSLAGLQLLVMTVLGIGVRLSGHPVLGALTYLAGALWAMLLVLSGWPLRPRAGEQTAVLEVYRVLGRLFDDPAGALAEFDAALKHGYDTLFGARSAAAGTDPERTRLVALLNQASLIRNALVTLAEEGVAPPPRLADTVRDIAAALDGRAPPPAPPEGAYDTPAMRALCDGIGQAVTLVSGGETGDAEVPREAVGRGASLRAAWEKMLYGHLTRVYTVRLALCMGVAAALSRFHPVERSYWLMLTVALVLKPDFGSVFTRAVQRGLGTVVGALIGTVVLIAVPFGPWLLVAIAVFAALLPYGQQRNWGMMTTFQAPLVVLLVDLLTHAGPRLALIRLVDTLIGCAIVLVLGYLFWPASWHAPVGPSFAGAVSATARYLRHAFRPGDPVRSVRHREVYDALADLRTVFQRAVAEPAVISRRVTTWLPALAALEQVNDAIAAAVTRTEHGGRAPDPEAVQTVVRSLDDIAENLRAGGTVRPPAPEAELGAGPVAGLTELARTMRCLRTTLSGGTSGSGGYYRPES
ncbi:FUSC family protein [Sphaerisporangium aureirubrum]|uniref:FUSC family protein n=1 Tax=Sphaerisporangium aureirubrum TaxID=1544736 RepID=A0ABW1NIH7_9ACTN